MSASRPAQKGDHVFLVDGSSFIFRAYFQSMNQDARYNYRSDRLPTGAVRLFCTVLYKMIREGVMGKKPTHLAIIFDKSEDSLPQGDLRRPTRATGRRRRPSSCRNSR